MSTRITGHIPVILKREFHAWCARRGLSISEGTGLALRYWLDANAAAPALPREKASP